MNSATPLTSTPPEADPWSEPGTDGTPTDASATSFPGETRIDGYPTDASVRRDPTDPGGVLGTDPPPTPSRADPRWTRPALAALLVATAALYLWNLSASGWANAYYSAAAWAGSQDWTAFLFGSLDPANAITVDKAPAALWPMALSVRIFGLSSWSLLVPQALMGVGAVWLTYLSVRRWSSAAVGLLAGVVLALTPVAALMFRFDNPDALLVLLLVAAVYATQRGIEQARVAAGTRWFALAGVALGFAFLAKMLQAFVIVPVLVGVVLLAAEAPWWRRVRQVAVAGVATLVSAGWWVALVEFLPASSRPYQGGSQTNSVLELIFGYNGLGRLTGEETGSVVGGAPAGLGGAGGALGGMWGATGWSRLLDGSWGGQASWLLPTALVMFAVLLAVTWRAPRTNRLRAAALLWGGWLLVTAAVFSFGQGIIHEYYAVALAPAIAALVALGSAVLWRRRERPWAAAVAAVTVLGTAVWASTLLGRATDGYAAWARPVVLVAGVVAAVALVTFAAAARLGLPAGVTRVAATLAVPAALVAALLGPATWTWQTVTTPHTGSLPTAGPTVAGARGPGGAGGPGGFPGGGFPGGTLPQGMPAFPGGGFPGGTAPQGMPSFPGGQAGGGFGNAMGGPGGLLGASEPSTAVVDRLTANASSYTWAAAAVGAQNAAGYQLAGEVPVLAIGGFNGSDPSPTLAQFQQYVADGRIHWFIGGGGPGGSASGSNESSQIAAWVASTFTAVQVDGVTMYDLTAATTSTATAGSTGAFAA